MDGLDLPLERRLPHRSVQNRHIVDDFAVKVKNRFSTIANPKCKVITKASQVGSDSVLTRQYNSEMCMIVFRLNLNVLDRLQKCFEIFEVGPENLDPG